MKTISQIVEQEEVLRRNSLRRNCDEHITQGIKQGDRIKAVMFVNLLFSYNLSICMHIVDDVRNNNTSFSDAEKMFIGDNTNS